MKIQLRRGLFVTALATALGTGATQAATPEQIDQAVEKATAFLYSVQKDGHWEGWPEFHATPAKPGHDNALQAGDFGGVTAMAVHALLAAGENANDPKLKPAVDLLQKWPMRICPYALCQRDQVLEMLPRNTLARDTARLDGEYLYKSMRSKDQAKGLYYYFPGPGGEYDHSVSQFGVLGMWACGETGYEVPGGYWGAVEQAWQNHQDASGGWSYQYKGGGGAGAITASMTAAGVATLFITQDYVHSNEGLEPHGNINSPAIEKGMAWLGNNFPAVLGGSSIIGGAHTYILYGIERIGVAGGYKYFGTHDWFKEGADWLVRAQNGNGSWGDGGWLAGFNHNNVPATAFAMFFLTRGRAPLAFNKLRYEVTVNNKHEEGHWNQRPRDIAKILRWIEKKTERNLNWHVVALQSTPADELQDAPIAYLAGDLPLHLNAEDEAKLKAFVEDGGLILGNPDGNSKVFSDSFRALATKLFPSYEMRPLPPDHPIYTHGQFRAGDIRKKDVLLGLSNGVRELMLLPTYDWAKAWQGDMFAREDIYFLSSNIYLYAVGRTAFRQGELHVVRPNPGVAATATIKVARLDDGGNPNPEPGGWRRLAALLHNNDKIDLDIQMVKPGTGSLVDPPPPPPPAGAPRPTAAEIRQLATKRVTPDEFQATGGDPVKMQALIDTKIKQIAAELAAGAAPGPAANAKFKLALFSGTTKFTWNAAQAAEIKRFIAGGGTLLVEAAGGSPAFADSAERELLALFPTEAVGLSTAIPADDALYQGIPVQDWLYRRYVHEGDRRPHGPGLRGMKIQGRWAVLLSHEDLSNALLGRDTDGVVGYTADTGTALAAFLVKKLGK